MAQMLFTLITLFPEMFPGPLASSIAGKALDDGVWGLDTVPLRDYGHGKHQQVDDDPYGGGAGMVMRPDVVDAAIADAMEQASERHDVPPQLLYMTPRGERMEQSLVKRLTLQHNLVILCGRFEGVDQRVLDKHQPLEVSLGDFVLSGGEIAALSLMDACIRLLPGVMSDAFSHAEESVTPDGPLQGLLEYPHYTRPARWNDREVPEVLLSGDHQRIARWRREKAEEETRQRRQDVWQRYARQQGE